MLLEQFQYILICLLGDMSQYLFCNCFRKYDKLCIYVNRIFLFICFKISRSSNEKIDCGRRVGTVDAFMRRESVIVLQFYLPCS